MKYKPPHSAAIFFWPIFTRKGGAMAPLDHPGTASDTVWNMSWHDRFFFVFRIFLTKFCDVLKNGHIS